MIEKKVLIKTVILSVLGLVSLSVWFLLSQTNEGVLEVRFLDVGQGDSIHIKTPDGFEALIDGGSSAAVLRELASGRSFFDRDIDLLVATHPDTDHVGGLVDVLQRYEVDNVLLKKVEHEATAAEAFTNSVMVEQGTVIIEAEAGQDISLGASTTLRVLSPRGDVTNWQSNNASIVIQLVYGDVEFMLTGDAPSSIEDFLVGYYGSSLESEVLKLGHHGSKTSTSELFLDTVQPQYAVVSAGKNNRYGHPAREVVERVQDFGSTLLSTAEISTIVFQSDGRDVWLAQ